jgi:hypothetical protein
MVATEELKSMSDDQFRHFALELLSRELGLYGYARFLRVYRPGSGDYTRDRHLWQDKLSMDEIVAGMAQVSKK